MFTHGHTYNVKYTLSQLKSAARSNGADIVLYGHTHVAKTEYDDGLYVMNPGSISHPREGAPSYGVVEISSAGVFLNIIYV